MKPLPPILAAAHEADETRRRALIAYLDGAEPSPEALALARLVPAAVWPWEIRDLALVIDFDRLTRSK